MKASSSIWPDSPRTQVKFSTNCWFNTRPHWPPHWIFIEYAARWKTRKHVFYSISICLDPNPKAKYLAANFLIKIDQNGFSIIGPGTSRFDYHLIDSKSGYQQLIEHKIVGIWIHSRYILCIENSQMFSGIYLYE